MGKRGRGLVRGVWQATLCIHHDEDVGVRVRDDAPHFGSRDNLLTIITITAVIIVYFYDFRGVPYFSSLLNQLLWLRPNDDQLRRRGVICSQDGHELRVGSEVVCRDYGDPK